MNSGSTAHKIFLLLILAALCASCTFTPAPTGSTPTSRSPTTVYQVPSYITELTLVGLTQKSELIVRGRITGSEGIVNMARDVNDYSKPDPRLFGIGQMYGFEVTQKLKSSGAEGQGSIVKIMQAEGMITSPVTFPPSQEEIETARQRYPFFPLIKNQEYILFLHPLKEFDNLKGYYTGTAHPWQFIVENGCAYPETPWYHAKYYYQPQETEKFVAEIIASLSAKVTPQPKMVYPAPGGVKSDCPSRAKPEVPYP